VSVIKANHRNQFAATRAAETSDRLDLKKACYYRPAKYVSCRMPVPAWRLAATGPMMQPWRPAPLLSNALSSRVLLSPLQRSIILDGRRKKPSGQLATS
jgi:hypothetical protein